MKIIVNFHTEDYNVFSSNLKKNSDGSMTIPETNSKIHIFCHITDHNCATGPTKSIKEAFLDTALKDVNKVADWIVSQVKDHTKRITLGDLKSYPLLAIDQIDKSSLAKALTDWMTDPKFNKK